MPLDISRAELIAEARRFNTKKSLGQNFLVEPLILEDIVTALNLKPGEVVIEIGAGLGYLTRYLQNQGVSVIAVEIDAQCLLYLEKMKAANTTILLADFLSLHPENLKLGSQVVKVVGNVPYQITAPIVRHLFGEIDKPSAWGKHITSVVLTVQNEVAQRFVATPGGKDYSQISLLVQYYAQPCLIRLVPSDAFFPPPLITSAVVSLTPHGEPPISCVDKTLLRKVIKLGFAQRRKMLKNNLLGLAKPEVLKNVFEKLNFDPLTRAERLSLQQFALLADELKKSSLADQLVK